MLNPHNQFDIGNDKLILLYDNRQPIYGTDGVLFACNSDGNIFRAIKAKADMGTGSLITDTNKWLRVDLISGQSVFNTNLGAVKQGLELVLGSGMELSIASGSLDVFSTTTMKYTHTIITAKTNSTFSYISHSGTPIETGQTVVDSQNWDDNGTKTLLARSNHTSFQKVYMDVNGDVYIMRGSVRYTSLNSASYKHISEEIPNLQSTGKYFIGGLLIKKSTTALDSTKVRKVFASKIGESHAGGGGSYFSMLKEPIEDETELKTIESPTDGEMRQETSVLPLVKLHVFNSGATSGVTPDDGTTGRWNEASSGGVGKVNPSVTNGMPIFSNATGDMKNSNLKDDAGVLKWIDKPILTDAYIRANYPNDTRYGHIEFRNNSGVRGAYIGFGDGNQIVDFILDHATKLKINGGNVGFDVNNPAYKLDINGDVNLNTGKYLYIGGVKQLTGRVASAWLADIISFQNSWSATNDASWKPTITKFPDGTVHIRGLISGGGNSTVVGNLPARYRPLDANQMSFQNAISSTWQRVDIGSNGDITCTGDGTRTGTNWMSLNLTYQANLE